MILIRLNGFGLLEFKIFNSFYKEPIKVPGKLNPEKQEAFIQGYKVLKDSLKEDEELLFMDAVHPEFQSKAVCGWIKSGEVKTLPTTSAQYRMHFIGTLALKGIEGICSRV